MYQNFKEYWELKSSIYEKLGVSRDTAYQIWCDAADLMNSLFINEMLKSNEISVRR